MWIPLCKLLINIHALTNLNCHHIANISLKLYNNSLFVLNNNLNCILFFFNERSKQILSFGLFLCVQAKIDSI